MLLAFLLARIGGWKFEYEPGIFEFIPNCVLPILICLGDPSEFVAVDAFDGLERARFVQ